MAAGAAGAKGGRAEKGTARSFHGMTFYATSPPRAVPRAVGGGGHRARGAAWASCGILLRFAVFAVLAVATAAAAMGGGFMMAVREPEAVLAGGGAATHRSLDAASVSKAGALGGGPLASAPHSSLALSPRTRAPPSVRPRDARRHLPRDQASSRRRRRHSDGSGTRGHGATSASVAPRSGPSSQGRRPPGLTVAGAHQSGTLAHWPAFCAGRTDIISYNASTTTRSLLSNTSSWAGCPLFNY